MRNQLAYGNFSYCKIEIPKYPRRNNFLQSKISKNSSKYKPLDNYKIKLISSSCGYLGSHGFFQHKQFEFDPYHKAVHFSLYIRAFFIHYIKGNFIPCNVPDRN